MAQIICIRLDWNHTAIPLRIASKYFTLHVAPEPAHPFGRKGLALAGAWHQLTGPDIAGMLILDGDVAIDPHDHHHMLAAIDKDPHDTIYTASRRWPVRPGPPTRTPGLGPAATGGRWTTSACHPRSTPGASPRN
jgi:hypothetical protein